MAREIDVSDDVLATFQDADADERERWRRVESEALNLCGPLATMIGHKELCWQTGVSAGQLTRELSTHYENRLSLVSALSIGRRSQNEKLARVIVADGLGMRLGEWQKRKTTDAEELAALRAECRDAGAAGQVLLERAARRAKGGR